MTSNLLAPSELTDRLPVDQSLLQRLIPVVDTHLVSLVVRALHPNTVDPRSAYVIED